jgi:hypothetical protein
MKKLESPTTNGAVGRHCAMRIAMTKISFLKCTKCGIIANQKPVVMMCIVWCKHIFFTLSDMLFWELCVENEGMTEVIETNFLSFFNITCNFRRRDAIQDFCRFDSRLQ